MPRISNDALSAAAPVHLQPADPDVAAAPVDQAVTPTPDQQAPVRTKRVRRVPPQDAFGFYDPRQCGFSALFAKLNAINERRDATPKKRD
ncbi:MAG: hypothetical protein A3H97_23215 [Acidobacteria bacterium RIFCSPLOWO2_02_FULL_65_29]|nr:MAG: hypothetical protein A3H97_23215 [Acidobacteria bacterium RIFCSPLOWO2_02_FULL_65_29]